MRKLLRNALLLFLLAALAVFSAGASAECPGFGRINADDVAIRKEARGQKITRLQKDSSVWITGSKTDSRGELWYHVRAQENAGDGYTNRSGWVRAEFVDAGSSLWHDVRTVKAAIYGMIALRTDGTVLCAGHGQLLSPEAAYAGLRDIRQIGICTIGWGFFAVDSHGRLYRDGIECPVKSRIRLAGSGDLLCITEDNRLQASYEGNVSLRWKHPETGGEALLPHVTAMADSHARYLFLTDDGRVCAADSEDEPAEYYPEPEWETWTDAAGIEASICSYGTYVLNGHRLRKYVPAFAAVRKDGTVLAAPAELAGLTADWQDIRQVSIGADWVLGLKRDGTVVAAGIDGGTPPDVSGWTDITEISNGHTYCVGVKRDGTLVFAGDFEFDDD